MRQTNGIVGCAFECFRVEKLNSTQLVQNKRVYADDMDQRALLGGSPARLDCDPLVEEKHSESLSVSHRYFNASACTCVFLLRLVGLVRRTSAVARATATAATTTTSTAATAAWLLCARQWQQINSWRFSFRSTPLAHLADYYSCGTVILRQEVGQQSISLGLNLLRRRKRIFETDSVAC